MKFYKKFIYLSIYILLVCGQNVAKSESNTNGYNQSEIINSEDKPNQSNNHVHQSEQRNPSQQSNLEDDHPNFGSDSSDMNDSQFYKPPDYKNKRKGNSTDPKSTRNRMIITLFISFIISSFFIFSLMGMAIIYLMKKHTKENKLINSQELYEEIP